MITASGGREVIYSARAYNGESPSIRQASVGHTQIYNKLFFQSKMLAFSISLLSIYSVENFVQAVMIPAEIPFSLESMQIVARRKVSRVTANGEGPV